MTWSDAFGCGEVRFGRSGKVGWFSVGYVRFRHGTFCSGLAGPVRCVGVRRVVLRLVPFRCGRLGRA